MKINLLLDSPGDYRSGYLNVDPFAPENCSDGRVRGDVSDLSHTVDAGEAGEIIALDVLDYFPSDDVDRVLSHWLSRLRRGGTLTISVIDIREVSRAVLANSLSAEDVNELIHGKQEKPWQYRKTAFTLTQLTDVLSAAEYKILAKRIQNFRAIVTAQRI